MKSKYILPTIITFGVAIYNIASGIYIISEYADMFGILNLIHVVSNTPIILLYLCMGRQKTIFFSLMLYDLIMMIIMIIHVFDSYQSIIYIICILVYVISALSRFLFSKIMTMSEEMQPMLKKSTSGHDATYTVIDL